MITSKDIEAMQPEAMKKFIVGAIRLLADTIETNEKVYEEIINDSVSAQELVEGMVEDLDRLYSEVGIDWRSKIQLG